MLLLDRSKCRPAIKRKRPTFPPSYARNAVMPGPSGGGSAARVAKGGYDCNPGGYCGVIIGGVVKQRWCRRVPSNASGHRAIA